jgi:hypothetical protein
MAEANHDQVFHQIRMKALTQFQQQILFRRVRNTSHLGRQFRIPTTQIIDLWQGFDYPFRLPLGSVMCTR